MKIAMYFNIVRQALARVADGKWLKTVANRGSADVIAWNELEFKQLVSDAISPTQLSSIVSRLRKLALSALLVGVAIPSIAGPILTTTGVKLSFRVGVWFSANTPERSFYYPTPTAACLVIAESYNANPGRIADYENARGLFLNYTWGCMFDVRYRQAADFIPDLFYANWVSPYAYCPAGYAMSDFTGYQNPDPKGSCISSGISYPEQPPCPGCGNPIQYAGGFKIQVENDVRGGDSFPMLTRTYRSHRRWDGNFVLPEMRFGALWTDTYNRSIFVTRGGLNVVDVAFVNRPNGMYVKFGRVGGVWVPQDNIADRLTEQIDGSGQTTGWVFFQASDDSRETYSALGRLASLETRSGIVQTLTYSDVATPATLTPIRGSLLAVTNSFGRSLTFSYDTSGRVSVVTDSGGGQFAYTYDANNNLVTVTAPDNKVRTYHYGELANTSNQSFPNHLTGITDENSVRYATFKYDLSGRPIQSQHAGGVNSYTVSYPAVGTTSIVTDPLGTATTHSFQTVLSEIKPTVSSSAVPGVGTRSEARTNDPYGNVSSRTDYNGNRTNYSYDLSRKLETSRTEGLTAAGAQTSQTRIISTSWHPSYRIPTSISEPTSFGSKVTTFTHDPNGNILSKSVTISGITRTWNWSYDPFGRVLTATDPRTNTTSNTYYSNDVSQGTNRGMLANVTNAAGHSTTINSYNAHGQPLSITDANGLVTSMGYDQRQRLTSRTTGTETTIYEYDGVGQLTKVTLPDSSFLRYTYDGAHRLVEIKDGLNNRVVYTLDNMGNRTKEEYADPANTLTKTRSRVYDALNRLQRDIGGVAGQVTQFAYDANGNQTGTTDPLSRTTTQTYDALNRLLQVIDPVNGAAAPTKYEYDPQDNLTKVTDPKNLATSYIYNGFNELTSQVSPDTGTTSFTYDAAGNMLTKTDARGVVATYSYDALNRVTTISYPAYGGDAAETVTYTYDTCTNGKGRLCSLSDKTGAITYSYNTLGRVTAKSQAVAGLAQNVNYGYNSAGQLNSVTYPSGAVIGYGYLNNRITSLSINGVTVLANADYEPFGPVGEWNWGNSTAQATNKHIRYFDLDGRNTKIESVAGLEPTVIVYDGASRITDLQKLTGSAVDLTKSMTFGYDNLDRLTAATPNSGNPNPAQGFSYDGVGNRLSATIASSVTNYSYGATSHRLNSLTGATSATYLYDAAGNRASGAAATWTYGANNRPVQVSVGATTTTYLINALGQRVRKATAGIGVRFVYDEAGRLIGEYNDSGTRISETVWFNDLSVAVMK